MGLDIKFVLLLQVRFIMPYTVLFFKQVTVSLCVLKQLIYLHVDMLFIALSLITYNYLIMLPWTPKMECMMVKGGLLV